MTDISKKKEDAKKGIRALLLSAPTGLTFVELQRDYQDFFFTPLPGKEIGYNSAQDFIQDIPDVVQTRFEGGNLVLKAVADSTTKHIEKMVSKQKIDSRKQMKVNAKRSAAAMRSGSSTPQWSWKPSPSRDLYKPPPQRTYNNSSSNNWAGRGGNDSSNMDRQRNFRGQYQNSNNRQPPRFRQQAHHRTVPFVPAHIQRDIHDLVFQHREGLPLTHFSRIFRARYQVHLDPPQLGFQDEYDLLTSIPDIVSLKRFQQGEMRVLPTGSSTDGRPHMDRHPSGGSNTKSYSTSVSAPPHQKASKDDHGRLSPKPKDEEEDWDTVFDKEACNNIPEYVQLRIEKLINNNPDGIKASSLLFEYKKVYRIDLSIKSYGYNSAIDFVSDLSHIVRSERPNKFDWVLYPAKAEQSASSGPESNSQANKKTSDEAKPNDLNGKTALPPSASSSSTLLASHKVGWEVKEAICQVLSLNPNGIPLEKFVDTYEEMTGRSLKLEQYGVDSVKGFLHSLKDIVYIMLDVSDQPVVCLTYESGPRKFDLLKDRYKPITPAPMPSSSTIESSGNTQQQPSYPPQAVTPGCRYRPQTVTYIDTGNTELNYIELYVSFTTNPGHFWIQLRGPKTTLALEDLMDALEECYGDPTKASTTSKEKEYRMTLEYAKPGMVCAVIYPEDLYWHRGIITGCKDNLYEVFFVDYGNTCYVSLENMRFLKTKFLTLPAQAIRARLSNIQPISKTWSVRSRQRFLDLTRERPLLGLQTAFTNRILSLCLTDTSGKDDIHINDLLTHEGYAEFKLDTENCTAPEDNQTCTLVLTNDFLYGKPQTEGVGPENGASQKGQQKSSGIGGDGDATTWRRYVRQAQMSDDRVFNLIFLGGKDLYIMSSEISSLFFDEDIISAKLRSDKTNIPKVVVRKEEYPELYGELLSYEVPAISESTALLSLFPVKALPLMMEMYGKDRNLGDIKGIVLSILDWFDPSDPYWKGEDDQSTESGEQEEEEEDAGTDSQSVVSDSFKMEDLHLVLRMLQMKRNRSLKKLLEGGDAGSKELEVNALNKVEMDIRRVEDFIESIENKKAANEKKQSVSEPVNKAASSSSSLPSRSQSKQPLTAAPTSSSSLRQQPQTQKQQQPNPVTSAAATKVVPPVTATIAPTPATSSSATAASTLSHSALSSSMLAGLGGMGVGAGVGIGGTIGMGRGFGLGASSLPGYGGVGGSLDMGEMLRQQMNINSLLMSQMGMMNPTPMMPSLPLSMDQMQQQQAMLQQQMLAQQQQQQQLFLRCQQQQQQHQMLRPGLYPSSISTPSSMLSASSLSSIPSPPAIPQAPGFTNFNPLRGQVLGKPNDNTSVPPSSSSSSSTAVQPPSESNNMFCASLGRVLSSALSDQTTPPPSATQDQN